MILAMVWAWTLGCAPDAVPAGRCGEVSAAQGELVCAHAVPDDETWRAVSLPGEAADVLRASKYLVPVDPGDPLGVVVLNVNTWPLHAEVLPLLVPELSGMDAASYLDQTLYPDRRWWSGVLQERLLPDGGRAYTVTVWDDPADPASTVSVGDVSAVLSRLGPAFALGSLAFEPVTPAQVERARSWVGVPILDPSGAVQAEAYVPGEAWGTVRALRIGDVASAEASGALGPRDVLVVDVAPTDVNVPVAGVVTGTRQPALSHLSIRAAARGTPSCYRADALAVFRPYQGQLVHLVCDGGSVTVEPGRLEDATAWWDALRPAPVVVPALDLDARDVVALSAMATADAEDRRRNVAAYGSKAASLATLYARIDPALQLRAAAIPAGWMVAHLRSTPWPGAELPASAADVLEGWLAEEAFWADAGVRAQRLAALRQVLTEAPVDPDLLDAIAQTVMGTWGTTTTALRLRSSSNAEDALGFSGAGLYTSARGCLADDLDDDDAGPSLCDPFESAEERLSDALRAVWASTYNLRAFEERDWYGIDARDVGMGVLINDRSASELMNLVVFSGSPGVPGDDRVHLDAQIGDLEVVSATPGVTPERLRVSADGVVERFADSSVMPPGQVVVDAQLALEIAAHVRALRSVFPVDDPAAAGADVLLDTEWKVLRDGRLVIKQIRPFLRRAVP